MAKIVTISNTKGGSGKSTVTVLLASCLAIDAKKKVLVLDCDSQQSILKLRTLEISEGESAPYVVESLPPRFVPDYLKLHADKYDFIFLDLPRMTNADKDNEIYQLITYCDFLFIPVVAGQMDAFSTIDFLQAINEIAEFKSSNDIFFKIRGFINRKDRRKDNEAIATMLKDNGLQMLKNNLAQVKIIAEASTMDSILSTVDGRRRFELFYKEVKSQIRY